MFAPDQVYQFPQIPPDQSLMQQQFLQQPLLFHDGNNVMYANNQPQIPSQPVQFNYHTQYLHQIDANTFVPMEIVTPIMMDYGTGMNNQNWLAPQFLPAYRPLPVQDIPLPPQPMPNYFVHADPNGQLVFLLQGMEQMTLNNQINQPVVMQSNAHQQVQALNAMSEMGSDIRLTDSRTSTVPMIDCNTMDTGDLASTSVSVIQPADAGPSARHPRTIEVAGNSLLTDNQIFLKDASTLISEAREAVNSICLPEPALEVGEQSMGVVAQTNHRVADSATLTVIPKPKRIYKRKMQATDQLEGDNGVSNYTPLSLKRRQSKYSEEDLLAAVDDINSRRLSVARAAQKYGIPSGSVYYMLRKYNAKMEMEEKKRLETEGTERIEETNAQPAPQAPPMEAIEATKATQPVVKAPIKFSKKKKYTEENLQLALEAVSQGRLNQRQASIKHEVPYSTLRHQVLIYSKTEGRRVYTEDDSSKALEAIRSGEINPWQASRQFGIPYPTIYNRAKREMMNAEAQKATAKPEEPVPTEKPEIEKPDLPIPLKNIKKEIEVIDLDD